MSSRNKEALAQAASVRLVAAACAGQGKKWNQQEQLHSAAGSQAECRMWAEADDYTGIAAGSAWVKGVEKPAHWIPRHPMKKLAS